MRANAEVHPEAASYLRHECPAVDGQDFYRQLERVCDDPIGRSRMLLEPETGGYVERWFPFGVGVERIAIFHYDGDVVKVLRCRLSKPRRMRSVERADQEIPP